MKAVWYEKNGVAADVLTVGEMPVEEPESGELRIRLHASGVNPSDVKSRAGISRKLAFPRQIPNSDGAGLIDKVGPDVAGFAPGDRVWVYNGAFGRPHGTSAEFITLPSHQVALLPDGLDFAQGACLGIPGMTAHRCVFADGAVDGQWVLVAGGSGVVGHYAVQLAKRGGANVIATVSSAEKAQVAKAGGADHVLDYKQDPLPERVAEITGGEGVNRIVEVELTNLEPDMGLLHNGGTIAVYGMDPGNELNIPAFSTLSARNPIIRCVLVYTMPAEAKAQAVADLAKWCTHGNAQFSIARRFSLDDAAAAHEYVEAGTKIGHVVLEID